MKSGKVGRLGVRRLDAALGEAGLGVPVIVARGFDLVAEPAKVPIETTGGWASGSEGWLLPLRVIANAVGAFAHSKMPGTGTVNPATISDSAVPTVMVRRCSYSRPLLCV